MRSAWVGHRSDRSKKERARLEKNLPKGSVRMPLEGSRVRTDLVRQLSVGVRLGLGPNPTGFSSILFFSKVTDMSVTCPFYRRCISLDASVTLFGTARCDGLYHHRCNWPRIDRTPVLCGPHGSLLASLSSRCHLLHQCTTRTLGRSLLPRKRSAHGGLVVGFAPSRTAVEVWS